MLLTIYCYTGERSGGATQLYKLEDVGGDGDDRARAILKRHLASCEEFLQLLGSATAFSVQGSCIGSLVIYALQKDNALSLDL